MWAKKKAFLWLPACIRPPPWPRKNSRQQTRHDPPLWTPSVSHGRACPRSKRVTPPMPQTQESIAASSHASRRLSIYVPFARSARALQLPGERGGHPCLVGGSFSRRSWERPTDNRAGRVAWSGSKGSGSFCRRRCSQLAIQELAGSAIQ